MHGDRHSGATEGHLESFGDGACHVLEGPLPSVTVLPRIKATFLLFNSFLLLVTSMALSQPASHRAAKPFMPRSCRFSGGVPAFRTLLA